MSKASKAASVKGEPEQQTGRLDEAGQQEAQERSSVTVQVVHEAIRKQAMKS